MSVFQNQIMAGTSANQGTKYTLWAWGATDGNYQTGQGNNTAYSSPVQIGSDDDWTPMVAVEARGNHAIKKDGSLWYWGQAVGRGDGSNTVATEPVQIGTATNWYYCATGYYNHYAVNTSGELFTWGNNGDGQLGDGTKTARSSMVQVAGTTWAAAAGGDAHTIALRTDGTIWGWGNGGDGRTWHNTRTNYSSPVQGVGSTEWWGPRADVSIADGWEAGMETKKMFGDNQGYWSSMCITEDGEAWGCGWENLGAYAISGGSNSPRQVGSDTTWTNIDHVGFGGVGINDGEMFTWGGYNTTGDLGHGATGGMTAGTLYSWGGTGTATDCSRGENLGAQTFSGAIIGGTMYFSGHLATGQAGNGVATNRSSPVQGPASSDWVGINIGATHCIGVREG